MERKKERKVLIICICLLLVISLFPIPMRFLDGGTVSYSALTYTVTVYNRMTRCDETGQDGRLVGIQIDIFGKTIFDNSRFEQE